MTSVLLGIGYLTQTTKEHLYLIENYWILIPPSVGEEQVAKFETLFTAVRYICLDAHLKKD